MTRSPLGVVVVISPWNMSGILTARGFTAAPAMGNTIVLRPSEGMPYSGGLFFAEILEEAGFPAGVFNVVTCSRDSVVISPLKAAHILKRHVLNLAVKTA